MCGAGEIHVYVLGQVPTQGKVAVHKKLLRECQRKLRVLYALKVAFLQFVVTAVEVSPETYILWHPV